MNMKILAAAVVAVVIIGGLAAYFVTTDNGSGEGPIEVVDGSGNTIVLDEPLNDIVVVNTNIPKSMKILGLEEEVVGIGYQTANTAQNNSNLTALFPNLKDIPLTRDITPESIAKISDCIICPVSAMTLSAQQETGLKELGVTVIRLDCNGDSALNDLRKLTILFGETEQVMEAYDGYTGMYNSVVNNVKAAALRTDTSDETFLCYMASSESFYNQTSELSAMIETVYGKNAIRSISGLPLNTVTNSATESGIEEKIVELDAQSPIDKIFVRGAASSSALQIANVESAWNESVFVSGINYPGLSAVDAGEVYLFNSNVMSGCLSFVGYVLIAEICGIDTGYDVQDVIGAYNTTYGFNEPTEGLAFSITDGKAGKVF